MHALILVGILASQAPVDAAPLRVVVAGSAPFVVAGASAPEGLSVDIWKAAASSLGRRFELMPAPGVAAALEMLEAGQADVAVGPISITADRAEHVDFTQPYFRSSLAILAPAAPTSPKDLLLPQLGRVFWTALLGLLALLVLVGTLLWLAERKANPQQFPPGVVPGVGNGIWLAMVTLSTVGYGDRAPVTLPGRTVAGVWMLVSMVMASSLTAALATVFTLTQLPQNGITSAEQLHGRTVAVVAKTASETFARKRGARVVPADSLAHALEDLKSGRAEALVFDRPQLGFMMSKTPDETLRLSEGSYEPQGYGFAVRRGSPLAAQLDVALLRMRENGSMEELARAVLGADSQ